jgi:hypothetical protein
MDSRRFLQSAMAGSADGSIMGLPPGVRQTDKTLFAVRCKILDRLIHFIAF